MGAFVAVGGSVSVGNTTVAVGAGISVEGGVGEGGWAVSVGAGVAVLAGVGVEVRRTAPVAAGVWVASVAATGRVEVSGRDGRQAVAIEAATATAIAILARSFLMDMVGPIGVWGL